MGVDELLQEAKDLNDKIDHTEAEVVYEQHQAEVDVKMEQLIRNHSLDDLTQDQMVKFLDLTRNMSWDIPSALMALCSHLDADEYYYMHRPAMEYSGGFQGNWEPADKHFKEVHGWDMDDPRIDWSFDT